jgi:hypothetical protein
MAQLIWFIYYFNNLFNDSKIKIINQKKNKVFQPQEIMALK